jgi:hypothetical protein
MGNSSYIKFSFAVAIVSAFSAHNLYAGIGLLNLNKDKKILKKIQEEVKPLEEDLVFYHWGWRQNKEHLIHESFDPETVNDRPGQTKDKDNVNKDRVAGRGLYLSKRPEDTLNYGGKENPILLEVIVPKGTLMLDITNPKNKLSRKYRDELYKMNPSKLPFLVHYESKFFVLKTAKGVKIQEFSGDHVATHDILHLSDRVKDSDLDPNHKKELAQYVDHKRKHAFQKRIYKSDGDLPLPIPKTICHEFNTWHANEDLAHRIQEFQDLVTDEDKIEYFWRFDGTCGEYLVHGDEHILIRESNDNNPCKVKYPTQFKPQGGTCFEIVKGSSPEIILGKVDQLNCGIPVSQKSKTKPKKEKSKEDTSEGVTNDFLARIHGRGGSK